MNDEYSENSWHPRDTHGPITKQHTILELPHNNQLGMLIALNWASLNVAINLWNTT